MRSTTSSKDMHKRQVNAETVAAAGLTATLLLTLAASLIAVYSFRRVIAQHDVIVNDHAESLVEIQQLHVYAETKIAEMRAYLLTGTEAHRQALEQARDAFYRQLDHLEHRKSSTPLLEALNNIKRAEASHDAVASRFVEARSRQGWTPGLVRLFDRDLNPLRKNLATSIDTVEAARRNFFEQERSHARLLSARLFALLVASSASLVAILFVTAGLVRRFLRIRQQNEDELRRAHTQLEERVRERTAALTAANAELEAFSYSVSHDLRAPLRGIDGFSQALLEDYGTQLDEKAQTYLSRIRAGTQKMGALIDDLLKLSRLTRVEMRQQTTDLSATATSIVQELIESDPNRKVEVYIEPGMIAHGDAGLLKAALENLLANAWKFTSNQTEGRIDVGKKVQNDQTVYFVRDNGVGFNMAYSNKLFGAFQRLHKASEFPGTGVGLATVRRIIHRHGGRIWAESAVGKGATFYFSLQSEDESRRDRTSGQGGAPPNAA